MKQTAEPYRSCNAEHDPDVETTISDSVTFLIGIAVAIVIGAFFYLLR